MKIGYMTDVLGQATIKVEILDETVSGKLAVRRLRRQRGLDGSFYYAYEPIEIVDKSRIIGIQEEKGGEDG